MSLFERLLAEKLLEWSCIRSEIWQGKWWAGGRPRAEAGGVHATREGSARKEGVEEGRRVRERAGNESSLPESGALISMSSVALLPSLLMVSAPRSLHL